MGTPARKSASEPAPFVLAIRLDDCPPGRPVFLELQQRELVLIRLTRPDRVYCLDNRCPHAGANLAGGEVENMHLVCPQHHWRFHLETGACNGSPQVGVNCYETRIERGNVYVCLAPRIYLPPSEEM